MITWCSMPTASNHNGKFNINSISNTHTRPIGTLAPLIGMFHEIRDVIAIGMLNRIRTAQYVRTKWHLTLPPNSNCHETAIGWLASRSNRRKMITTTNNWHVQHWLAFCIENEMKLFHKYYVFKSNALFYCPQRSKNKLNRLLIIKIKEKIIDSQIVDILHCCANSKWQMKINFYSGRYQWNRAVIGWKPEHLT